MEEKGEQRGEALARGEFVPSLGTHPNLFPLLENEGGYRGMDEDVIKHSLSSFVFDEEYNLGRGLSELSRRKTKMA